MKQMEKMLSDLALRGSLGPLALVAISNCAIRLIFGTKAVSGKHAPCFCRQHSQGRGKSSRDGIMAVRIYFPAALRFPPKRR